MTTTRSEDLSQPPTLRDTFAAAALAGLLPVMGDAEEMHETCSAAYGWADAMLRERDATIHDAAPAARATEQARSPDQSPRGTGDTPRVQPAIDRLREWERHGSGRWGLGAAGDVTMLERRLAIVEAIVHDAAPAARAAELARSTGQSPRGTGDTPTLTDAEREAVTRGAELADHSGEHSTTAAALRGLLKRLK